MIKKINILILSMFAIGNSKYAPGTVASFITSLIFIFFYFIQVNILFLILGVSTVFIFSVYSIDRFKNSFSEVDAKEIVIDEFVGQSVRSLAYNDCVRWLLRQSDQYNGSIRLGKHGIWLLRGTPFLIGWINA